MWAGQQAGLTAWSRLPCTGDGPQGGNGNTEWLSEEGLISASAALLGWLVWSSQLGERQVPGIQEWVVDQPRLQNAFFASAVQLLSEMPADTKVTED